MSVRRQARRPRGAGAAGRRAHRVALPASRRTSRQLTRGDQDQSGTAARRSPRRSRSRSCRNASGRGTAPPSGTRGRRRRSGCRRRVEQQRLGEQLQAADRRDDDHEQQRRAQQRDRDARNCPEPAGAVHRRRVVQVPRDGLHGGQQDQRVVAGPAPVDHGRDGEPGRPPCACQSTGSSRSARAGQLTRPKSRPKSCAKTMATAATEVTLGGARPSGRRYGRAVAVEQAGQAEREQDLRDRREQEDPEGVDERVPEVLVVEQRPVVVEPDERVRAGRDQSQSCSETQSV